MIFYTVSVTLIHTLQQETLGTFIYHLGQSFDALGMYFLFRCLIRNWQDIDRLIIGCIIISIPVMAAFAIEKTTQRNMFFVFGGVPEFTMIRDGKLHARGLFPIRFWRAVSTRCCCRYLPPSGGKKAGGKNLGRYWSHYIHIHYLYLSFQYAVF